MANYPIVLRNYFFTLGIFAAFPIASEAFSQGSFDGLDYVNFVVHEFSSLDITSIGRNLIQDENDCAFACIEIPSCFSYNVAVSPDINGKLLCELLPSDKYNNSDKFLPSQFFHHFSIPSPCSSSPCKNNERCISLYKEKSYKCVCKEGFSATVQNCETNLSINSTVLAQFLAPAVGNDTKWLLCYRGSTHGWHGRTFHSRCDGKPNTVTIIKTGPYVFGGYTDVPWDSSNSYKYSSKSFIFSLRDNEGLAPFMSKVTTPRNAILCRPYYGPIFGLGYDISVAPNATSNSRSRANFGASYSLPSGAKKRETILAGSLKFTPDEVEVFYPG